MSVEKAEKALNVAFLDILEDKRYIFSIEIYLRLNKEICHKYPTLAVGNTTLYINPDFFLSLTPAQRVTGILHELAHIERDHLSRGKAIKDIDFKLYNMAADYLINHELVNVQHHANIEGILLDPRFTNQSTEQVYAELKKDYEDNPDDEKFEFEPDIDNTGTESDHATTDNILVQAALATAQSYGNECVPEGIRHKLAEILQPTIRWEKLLQKLINRKAKNAYNWNSPERFYLRHGIYLPSLDNQEIGTINVYADVSGSINKKQHNEILTEITGMFSVKPKEITYTAFSTKLMYTKTFKNKQEVLDTHFVIGGGTKIQPVIDHIKETNPVLSVVFTDGEYAPPIFNKFHNDIIWVINGNKNFTCPKGKIIHYQAPKIK